MDITDSGLPLLTRVTFSACRAHYPGGSVWVLLGLISALPRRVSSPTALAFPYTTDGRHPRYSFRGLLELHWCYGLQICSPTFGGLGCEAPMKSVTKLHRSSAIQAYRDLLVRDFHPLVIHAARAHVVLQRSKGVHGQTLSEVIMRFKLVGRRVCQRIGSAGVRLRQQPTSLVPSASYELLHTHRWFAVPRRTNGIPALRSFSSLWRGDLAQGCCLSIGQADADNAAE